MSFRNSAVLAAALTISACRPAARPAGPAATPRRPHAVAALQHQIDDILAAPALQRGYWGVLVESLQTGETLYALNARKLLMPASNMKIITLAAAAERLGWDYTYETRLVVDGSIASGTLDGDLVVIGSGDPSLTEKDAACVFNEWADGLKAAGVTRVSGRIVGDDGAFDEERLGMGWSWDDLPDGYATGVGALQYNENVVHVVVSPATAAGLAAAVAVRPEGSGLAIRNRVETSAEADATGIEMRRLPGSPLLELRGSVPFGGPPRVLSVSVPNPTIFFVNALRAALIERGVDVTGTAVDIHDMEHPPSRGRGTTVAVHRSPALSALADTMMKVSQNLYAETLLKTLGTSDTDPATIAAGRRLVAATLKAWNVGDGGVIARDGSGLSRYNYVTAEALVVVLAHVDGDPKLRGPFEAALPMLGSDGTLANRAKGTPAEGRVRAKTGSMANVRALSGYAVDADGEALVFSILANNFEAPPETVTKAADAIVIRLAEFRR